MNELEAKQKVVDEMIELGIEGVEIEMTTEQLKRKYKIYIEEKNQDLSNEAKKELMLNKIRETKSDFRVTSLKGVTVAPDNCFNISEVDIFNCAVKDNKFFVVFKEGGKYKYDFNSGDIIR